MEKIDSKHLLSSKNLASDIPAGLVVFLIAVPLCLGIALASKTSMLSGLIAGIIGGIVVGAMSKSHVGVSGPAAGLVAIVTVAIADLGSFEILLLAIVIAGALQIALGALKLGGIAYYFPNSVIKGMLSAIGLIIISKQIPHAVGLDKDYEGDLSFFQSDGKNTFTELFEIGDFISINAVIVSLISLVILILWEMKFMKKVKIFQIIQGPLVVVVIGIVLKLVFDGTKGWEFSPEHLVAIPKINSIDALNQNMVFPDFSAFSDYRVYITASTIALVASLETLLSLEASEKLDRYRRFASANQELIAQGTGNIISGLIGGLPITQVIVRTSANVQSNNKTKISAIFHGILLLISVVFIPNILNQIPLSALAAILFLVGYKLAKPQLFKSIYAQGHRQFIPFMVTVIVTYFTSLLAGILIGLVFSTLYILYSHYTNPYIINLSKNDERHEYNIRFSESVSFLHKARIRSLFGEIPEKSNVIIDASKTVSIDSDILEVISDFIINSEQKDIEIELKCSKDFLQNKIEQYVEKSKNGGNSGH